jgi:hypothetical protein
VIVELLLRGSPYCGQPGGKIMKDSKTLKPFFSKYLVGNITADDLDEIKGGSPIFTIKYPSDVDEEQIDPDNPRRMSEKGGRGNGKGNG